jgi:hypothetical protein
VGVSVCLVGVFVGFRDGVVVGVNDGVSVVNEGARVGLHVSVWTVGDKLGEDVVVVGV